LSSTSSFASELASAKASNNSRLAFAITNLGVSFLSVNIDGTFDPSTNTGTGSLGTIAANLAAIRTAGMKAILRFTYNEGGDTMASVAQMRSHMAQLKPILYANRDVLYVVQGGFLGQYGEWWVNTPGMAQDSQASRTSLKDGILDMVPPEVPVNITCINCLVEWWMGGAAVSADEAFNGTQRSRLGYHADCIMASVTDTGGYPSPWNGWPGGYASSSTPTQQRAFSAAQSEYTPFGGETCGFGTNPRPQCYSTLTDNAGQLGGIMREGPRYHIAYLNSVFYSGFISQWKSDGCMPSINTMMGYRFQFDSISHPSTAVRGSTASFNVNMRNTGWSRIFSARPLRVVLSNGSSIITGTSTTLLRQ
jgi:hypothetical protein